MRFFNLKEETMSREEIRQLQLERLQATLNRVMRNVAFYQTWFKENNVLPNAFRTLEDLPRLPLITRETLARNHPYGMFAVPLREVVRLHPNLPNVGSPFVIGYTKNDVLIWTKLKARGFAGADMTKNDLVQVYLDYSLFPGAVVAHYGAEELGACVTPLYTMPVEDQIALMQSYRTTVLICTPTRAMHIVRYIRLNQVDPKSLFLRTVLLVGNEMWSSGMRKQIEDTLFVDVFGNYGVPEICTPGVAYECQEKAGFHINEDHFYAEIIDPETGRVLPHGEKGELVITTLTKEAFPLIRFRTGDITTLLPDECPCGRTFVRMENVASRSDELIIVDGVEFVPAEIASVLSSIENVSSHFCLNLLREGIQDRLEIEVEVRPSVFNDKLGSLEALRERIEEQVYRNIRIKPLIKMVEPKSLEGRERVNDLRSEG
ncbi:MAG: phenylacetate--CoA ligase [bacterium]|jgi:phenylacetate-CoA ligase|nr:phenylacetate--CoA ligase [bacterium]